ncbi:hypothetical protein NECAME_05844 [Necator americanus]|uniref:Uncharacterized protein n=1 Tax=Necator americanus TaxID=51031 RepID=W2U0B1_NECAM|nr:hypothetical protein NECAME_05844 [Necator americanus]ETN86756.1 hypothetical protein NECAME_05844 [Necator americanus]
MTAEARHDGGLTQEFSGSTWATAPHGSMAVMVKSLTRMDRTTMVVVKMIKHCRERCHAVVDYRW